MGKWKFAQVAQAEDLDGRWLADLAKRAAKLGHDVAGLDIEELEELIRGPADEPELAIVVGPEEPLRIARALVAKVTDPEIAEMVHSVEEAYELLSKALDLIPESMTDLQEEVLAWVSEEWGSKAEAAQIERQESYRFDSWPITFAGFEPGALMAKAEQIVAAETAADPETVRHTQRGPWAVTMRGSETKMDLARLTAVNDLGDSIYITKKVVVPAVISYFGPQTQPGVMRWEAHLVTAGEDRVLYTSTDPNAVSDYLQSFMATEVAEEVSMQRPVSVMGVGELKAELKGKVRGYSRMRRSELQDTVQQVRNGTYTPKESAMQRIDKVVQEVRETVEAQRDQPVTVAEVVAEQVAEMTREQKLAYIRQLPVPFEKLIPLLTVARADIRYKGVPGHRMFFSKTLVDENDEPIIDKQTGEIKVAEWSSKTCNPAIWVGQGWKVQLLKVK